ncbi:MAG TPA: DUF2442 domain-containing protein [Spirochaetota bacterium]|nr:DUF2442 domain-containing protein [Spirochaetota bacterium]
MIKIRTIKVEKDYKIFVVFENNLEKLCDISQFLQTGSFSELRDEELFNQVKNKGYSIEWPNELDLSSDTLISL